MIASQYKNIIQWTVGNEEFDESGYPLNIVRRIFDNLGVAFPKGELDKILDILKSGVYMGWRACSKNDVQKYADLGVASLGIAPKHVVIILPDDKISNFALDKSLEHLSSDIVKHISAVTEEESREMSFFVYSYGYIIS